jgi:restriction endonuclease fold toxin 7 of polymorphic toxin system
MGLEAAASEEAGAAASAEEVADSVSEAYQLGQEAEQSVAESVNMAKNTSRIPSWTGNANYRIPDFWNQFDKLLEVKNVAYQYLSSQILDMAYFCVSNGTVLYLAVRPDTVLSPQVLEAVQEGFIILQNIP